MIPYLHTPVFWRPPVQPGDPIKAKPCKRCGIEIHATVNTKYCRPCAAIRKAETIARAQAKLRAKRKARKG